MSSSETIPPHLLSAIGALLSESSQKNPPFTLHPLSGGANNQVFRVEREGEPPRALKRYFHSPEDSRDRFLSEKSFYDFLQSTGNTSSIAQPLAWNREERLGLFSWIQGRRLLPTEVDQEAVDQALNFYFSLNADPERLSLAELPSGSEACFDLQQHFDCVERRLQRLATIDPSSILGSEVLDFVTQKLQPAFLDQQRISSPLLKTHSQPLLTSQRCLSPSDFGFHNTLWQEEGRLIFFDFEYAGLDDPAKFLCDFLCQPALPVPQALWPSCFHALCRPSPGGTNRERINLLLPLYHLKWCCITLNEFLPRDQHRRRFAQNLTQDEVEKRKLGQLDKAQRLLSIFEQLADTPL